MSNARKRHEALDKGNKPRQNVPKQQQEQFAYFRHGAMNDLTGDEASVYGALIGRVTWENNFVKDADGSFMSISEIAVAIARSRPFVAAMLRNLQDKKRLRIVSTGRGKPSYVYLYSAYYWPGRRNHANDDALTQYISSLEE